LNELTKRHKKRHRNLTQFTSALQLNWPEHGLGRNDSANSAGWRNIAAIWR
jgi:hypothetical protein